MTNILLYAFTSDNLGDDLFIKLICNRYPYVNFHLPLSKENANSSLLKIKNLHLSKNLENFYNNLKKESIINNHLKINSSITEFKYKNLLKDFDIAIYVVGSAFIQKKPNKDYSNLILLDKMVKTSKAFFLINANFGPFFDEKYLQTSRKIISKMTWASFRDEYSYNLFKDLKNTNYGSDIVLSINKTNKTNNKNVLISVMDLGDEYVNFIINIIKEIIKKGFNAKLVSFCESQNDNKTISIINEKIKTEKYIYNGNIDELLDEFASSHAVVATRFHSMILAFAYNKMVLPIIYSQKTKKVIEDAKFNGNYIELNKLNNYDFKKLIDDLLSKNIMISDEYKALSLNHFILLDKFIGKTI